MNYCYTIPKEFLLQQHDYQAQQCIEKAQKKEDKSKDILKDFLKDLLENLETSYTSLTAVNDIARAKESIILAKGKIQNMLKIIAAVGD